MPYVSTRMPLLLEVVGQQDQGALIRIKIAVSAQLNAQPGNLTIMDGDDVLGHQTYPALKMGQGYLTYLTISDRYRKDTLTVLATDSADHHTTGKLIYRVK